jgi:hypothetical protein
VSPPDAWADRREALQEAVLRGIDAIELSHGELAREQVQATEPASYETAALACLAACEAAGGRAQASLAGAASIAFLSQMALVFMGMENARGASSLSTAWGMPRSLNAGDAMFAAAQHSLLTMPEEITAENHLQAVMLLDEGAKAIVDALLERPDVDVTDVTQRALLPAAMGLGGLLGGGGPEVWGRLQSLGKQWSILPADEMSRRLAAEPRSWLAT